MIRSLIKALAAPARRNVQLFTTNHRFLPCWSRQFSCKSRILASHSCARSEENHRQWQWWDRNGNFGFTAAAVGIGMAAGGFGILAAACEMDVRGRDKNPLKKLLSAARYGNAEEIKILLSESKIDPNERHAFGWTALHVAAMNGEPEAVKALLEGGADPDIGDDYTNPFKVGRELKIPAVEAMIVREKEFSDLLNNNKSYKNCTALHYAVLADNEKCVKALLDAGANPLEVNTLGHEPIEYAVTDSTIYSMLENAEKDFSEKLREKEAEERRRYPLESRLKEKIVGQEAAIACVAAAIRRKENGWVDDEHPLVFLFLGSSGIGKTELAKQVAQYLHGRKKKSEGSFIRLDMSEYQEKHEVAKLIGAPPGYVGHDDGGNLTKRLTQFPNAVVLFDEIDKAHPDVLTVLLQLFDEGRLTDGKGKTIECKDAIFIMTSNLASEEIATYAERLRREVKAKMRERYANILHAEKTVANTKEKEEMESTEKRLSEEMVTITDEFKEKVVRPILKRHFRRDEFLGRINEMIYFLPFSQAELLELTDREMVAWAKRASDRHGVTLTWTKDVLLGIARGYNIHYGARSIKHEVERKIVGPIAAAHEQRKIRSGSAVYVSAEFLDDTGSRVKTLSDSHIQGDGESFSSSPTVEFTFKIKQPGSSAVETFVPDKIATGR